MNKYDKAAVYLRGNEYQHAEADDNSLWVEVWCHDLSATTDIRVHEEQVDEYAAEYDTDPAKYDQLEKEYQEELRN